MSLNGSPTVSRNDAGLVGVAALADDNPARFSRRYARSAFWNLGCGDLEEAGFNVLFGVVPSAANVLEEDRQDDAADGADHQQRRYRSGPPSPPSAIGRALRSPGLVDYPEGHSDDDWRANYQQARSHHSFTALPSR